MNHNDHPSHAPEPDDVSLRSETQSDPDGLPLTEEEMERYRDLLAMAYPGPKSSLKKGVLERIQAEKARKRMLRRRRFVRYGSMAACFVLFAAAIALLIPYLNQSHGARIDADTPSALDVSSPIVNSLPAYASTEPAPRTNRAENDGSVSDGMASDGSVFDGSASDGKTSDDSAKEASEEEKIAAPACEDAILSASLYQMHRDASNGSVPDGSLSDGSASDDSLSAEIAALALTEESEQEEAAEENAETASLSVESQTTSAHEKEASPGTEGVLEAPAMDTDCEIPETAPVSPTAPPAFFDAGADSLTTDNQGAFPLERAPEPCSRHSAAYHTFSKELIDFAGEALFSAWYASEEAADDCGLPSVATFARDFSLDRAAFAGLVESSVVQYDLDEIFPEP